MDEELSAIAEKAPSTDDLVRETRNWAQQRAFQLGAHMLRGAVEPREAARPAVGHPRHLSGPGVWPPSGGIASPSMVRCRTPRWPWWPWTHTDGESSPSVDHSGCCFCTTALLREPHLRSTRRRGTRHCCSASSAYSANCRLAGCSTSHNHRGLGKVTPLSAYSLRAFEEYYAERSSAADLRTLVHARIVFADGDLGGRLEALREAVLGRERQLDALGEALSALRPKRDEGRWDVLDAPGGLMDIELLVEHLHLAAGTAATDSTIATDGLAATLEAGAKGLIDTTVAADLAEATRLWQNFDGFMRMVGVDQDPTLLSPEEQTTLAQACDVVALEDLASLLAATRQRSAAHIDRWFSMYHRRAETAE